MRAFRGLLRAKKSASSQPALKSRHKNYIQSTRTNQRNNRDDKGFHSGLLISEWNENAARKTWVVIDMAYILACANLGVRTTVSGTKRKTHLYLFLNQHHALGFFLSISRPPNFSPQLSLAKLFALKTYQRGIDCLFPALQPGKKRHPFPNLILAPRRRNNVPCQTGL